jgi:hypothetical protein
VLVFAVALNLRTAGLFRGLSAEEDYHPDVAKQMRQLSFYLSGNYTAHFGGDLFYDGYPFGLNRIDEGFIRLIRPVLLTVRHHLVPEFHVPGSLEGIDIYYWARMLRVVYGMFVVLAAYLLALMLGMRRREALLASSIMAIAPLSVTVSHTATGDIGVDMFTALVFLFMACLARRARFLLLLPFVGFAVAFAFASKYQGLFVAWVPFAFFFLRDGILGRKWLRLTGIAIVLSVAFAITVVIANPIYLVHPVRTWRELMANFVFLSTYGADPKILAQPLIHRIVAGFRENTPLVFSSLGFGTVVLAAIGLNLCIRQVWRRRFDVVDDGALLLKLAFFSFPFVAMVISLAMKPSVQPFHFSSLQLPLALSAAFAVGYFLDSPKNKTRLGVVLMAVAMLAELGHQTVKDNYFWKREDIKNIADDMCNSLVYSSGKSGMRNDVVRRLILEPENVSIFRNRAKDVAVPYGYIWNALEVPPVPCIPYPLNHEWIFMNGPVLPRSDRMFKVQGNTAVDKKLIFYSGPVELKLGIRSGFSPAEITVQSGNQSREMGIAPDSYDVVKLVASCCKRVDMRGEASSDVYIVPITVTARHGDAWVTVLGSKREEDNFLLFSGKADDPSVRKQVSEYQIDKISSLIADARYFGGSLALLELPHGESCLILEDALPAGVYRLELGAVPLAPDTRIKVLFKDMFDRELPALRADPADTIPVTGSGLVTAYLEKPFAPYQIRVEVRCVAGSCALGIWRIQPDAKAIIGDLRTYTNNASMPEWLGRYKQETGLPSNRDKFGGVVFNRTIELDDVSFPATIRTGTNEFLCFMRMNVPMLYDVDKYQVFLHFIDANNKQAGSSGITLHQAVSAEESGLVNTLIVPAGLQNGKYEVRMGICNIESGKRMKIVAPTSRDVSIDSKGRLLIGHTTVVSGEKQDN